MATHVVRDPGRDRDPRRPSDRQTIDEREPRPIYDVGDPTLGLGGGRPEDIFTALGHWADEASSIAPQLGLSAFELRTDAGARAEGARGVALGGAVHLDTERIRPGTAEGREVLAHELVHLAQAKLPADQDVGRAAAEDEATEIARSIASGGPARRPSRHIDLSRPAADHGRSGHDGAPTAPVIPAGHTSREISVEFGEGSITGGITATLEHGKTGFGSIGPAELKTLERTTQLKINGFARTVQASILNGELAVDMIDGVQIAVEVSVGEVSKQDAVELDLVTVEVKARGDITHWIDAPPGTTMTLDGRIAFALGGKLAQKAAKVLVARLEQVGIGREIEAVNHSLAAQAKTHAELVTKRDRLARKLASGRGDELTRSHVRELEAKIAEKARGIEADARRVEALAQKIDHLEQKAAQSLRSLRGKLAQKVARAMSTKVVRVLGRVLARLLPIVNLIATIIDIVDVALLIKHVVESAGSEGGGGDREGEAGPGTGGADSSHASQDAGTIESARDALHPTAKALLAAIEGPRSIGLETEDIQLIDMMVPEHLSKAEMVQVLMRLRQGPGSETAADAIAALDAALRAVRYPEQETTVKVDGKVRHDLGPGPVTTPDAEPLDLDDPLVVAKYLPDALVATWFEIDAGQLVPSAAFASWESAHVGSIESGIAELRHQARRGGDGWHLTITFVLRPSGNERHIVHDFDVATDSIHGLVFRRFWIVGEVIGEAK